MASTIPKSQVGRWSVFVNHFAKLFDKKRTKVYGQSPPALPLTAAPAPQTRAASPASWALCLPLTSAERWKRALPPEGKGMCVSPRLLLGGVVKWPPPSQKRKLGGELFL